MEDMEELRIKQETSGRDLPFGMDKAWYRTQIWLKKWDGVQKWGRKNVSKNIPKNKFSEWSRVYQKMTACSRTAFWSYLEAPKSHIRQNPKNLIIYQFYIFSYIFLYIPLFGVYRWGHFIQRSAVHIQQEWEVLAQQPTTSTAADHDTQLDQYGPIGIWPPAIGIWTWNGSP